MSSPVSWVNLEFQKYDCPSKEMSNFLQGIQEKGTTSPQVAALIENILKNAELNCAKISDRIVEEHFLSDVMHDLHDLASKQADFEREEALYDATRASYYPRLGMSGASVCVLPNRSINDKAATFICNTSLAYRGTQRSHQSLYAYNSSDGSGGGGGGGGGDDSSGSSSSSGGGGGGGSSGLHFRVSIISSEEHSTGAPQVQPLDFSTDVEYWSFVRAITQAFLHRQRAKSAVDAQAEAGKECEDDHEAAFYWKGRGMISSSNLEKGDIAAFFSGAGGSASDHSVEITNDAMLVHAGTEIVLNLPLQNLIALALSCDWPAPADYVLEIDIQDNNAAALLANGSHSHTGPHGSSSGSYSMALLNSDLEIQRNQDYYQKIVKNYVSTQEETSVESTRVLIPLTVENLKREQTPAGLFNVAIFKGPLGANAAGGKSGAGGAKASAGAGASKQGRDNITVNMDDVTAIDPIPFASFKHKIGPSTSHSAAPVGGSRSTSGASAGVPAGAAAEDFVPVLNEPLIHRVRISADHPSHRAAEVHILGAVDLPLALGGKEPTTYCAVYLVDAQGEKINARGTGVSRLFTSAEEGEWKTDVISCKSSPMWDTKLVLQEDGDRGIDSVASIRIVLKSPASSVFAKPKHIGQVTIPIGCFIDGASVPLTLPLESITSRSSASELSDIVGTLHVIAKAVRINPGDVSPSTPASGPASVVKPINRGRSSSSVGMKDDSPDHISMQYTLKAGNVDALNTFWPFIVLGGGSSGYIALGTRSLIISMSPGAGGILANCEERKEFTKTRQDFIRNLAPGAMHSSGSFFTIDWDNVEEALPLTSSVLTLRLNVRKSTTDKGGKNANRKGVFFGRNEGAGNSNATSQMASVEVLIAPCPSRVLMEGFHERKNFVSVSTDMRTLRSELLDYLEVAGKRSYFGAQKLLTDSRALVGKLERCIEEHSSYDGNKDLAISAVRIEESAVQHSSASRWTKRKGAGDASGSHTASASVQTAQEVNAIILAACRDERSIALLTTRTKIRAQVYRVKLLDMLRGFSKLPILSFGQGSGSAPSSPSSAAAAASAASQAAANLFENDPDLLPVYTVASVQGVVKRDAAKLLSFSAEYSANLAAELFELHSALLKLAHKRVLDYVLCSADAENVSLAHDCLRELVSGYFTFMRQQFEKYLGSPAAFKRTPGQEAKIMLLQMAVFSDEGLDILVRRGVQCLVGKFSPKLTLLGDQFTINDVIQWYSASLQAETASWLSKTIKQAEQNKSNTHSLPWDYEESGKVVISYLPETVMKQNNSFLELCDHTATKFAFASASNDIHSYASDAAYESEVDKLRESISFDIRESSNRCMQLLAEEYQNALQIKNWSKSSSAHSPTAIEYNLAADKCVDEEANFMFLLSIANDCGRVIDQATRDLMDDAERPEKYSNVKSIKEVIRRFQCTADLVNLELFRVIFSDVHDLLIDFRNNWEQQSTLVVKKLIHNAESYLVETRSKLIHKKNHDTIVGYCANAIAGCFLMMIKSRANVDKKFVGGEFARFRGDVADMKGHFRQFLIGKGQAIRLAAVSAAEYDPSDSTDELLKPLCLLDDIADIMGTPFPAAGGGAAPTAKTAKDERLNKLMQAVTCTYPRIVCDGVLKDSVYMRATPNPVVIQLLTDALRSDASNERFTNFALPEEAPPQDVAFFKMICKIYEKASAPGSKSDQNDFFKGLRVGLSDVFSSSNEADKKAKLETAKFLRLLNLLDLDTDERVNDANIKRQKSLAAGGDSLAGGDGAGGKGAEQMVTLVISRMEVRGVVSSSFFSSPNPYLAVTVGQERVKSEVFWSAKGGAANWGEAALHITLSKSLLSSSSLEVEVFDKERIRRKRAIGKVTMKLGGLDMHRIENWFALKGGEHDGAEVYLCVDLPDRDD